MKIVILDGYTTNPGDLSWDGIAELGELTIYDRTPASEILIRAEGAEIVITNKTMLTKDIISQLPQMKYAGLLSTGTNAVDLAAAKEHNITVTNIPAYSTEGVTQMVFALLLELTNNVARHSNSARSGEWTSSRDFCYTLAPQIDLSGKTMGIVGYGMIGKRVAEVARAFGMKVLFSKNTPLEQSHPHFSEQTSLEDLLQESDVVSLHCPLTSETEKLINNSNIELMKEGALLINTGRGGLINEDDLAAALNSGRLGGAGVDVLSTEPPAADNPLLTAKNCVITPHIAWASFNSRKRLIEIATKNLKEFLNNTPQNVVNA